MFHHAKLYFDLFSANIIDIISIMGRKKFNSYKRIYRSKIRRQDKENLKLDTIDFAHLDRRPRIPLSSIDSNAECDKILANQTFYSDIQKDEVRFHLVDINQLSSLLFYQVRCGKCTNDRCVQIKAHEKGGLAAEFEIKIGRAHV